MSDLLHDAFYRFVRLEDPDVVVTWLQKVCVDAGVLGSVLLAEEGINGMLCGTLAQLQTVRDALQQDPRFAEMPYKRTRCASQVFAKLKIKRKAEIVALGLDGVDATQHKGLDVSPKEWQALLERDDVVVIDNRNDFEFRLGHFKNAINPGVENFRDVAAYFQTQLPHWQDKTIAMYCTGGIRCEKTGAWLAAKGLRVLQLEGGILNYFEKIPDASRDYQGTCFVFDARHALNTNGDAVAPHDNDV